MADIIDYLPFFNLKTQPFRLSPDPEFFFPAKPHRAALEVLKFAINRGEGFMVLTGCAGTGKTLLVRLLLRDIPETKLPAVIVTPAVSPEGLVRLLLSELNVSVDDASSELGTLLHRLQDALIELATAGRDLLIIIDESQDLPTETLEQLRLLSNIEFDDRKIVQILLLGQPELDHLLSHPGLRQLLQRIVINEQLLPLTQEETGNYITFRLARAGRADLVVTDSALKDIYTHTNGIPRMINRLMDRALLISAARGFSGVDREDVTHAAQTLPAPAGMTCAEDISYTRPATEMRSGWQWQSIAGVVTGIVLLMAAGGAAWWGRGSEYIWFSHLSAKAPGSNTVIASSRDHAPDPHQVIVVANRALVRKGPGDRFEFISAVSAGDLLTSRGMDRNWVMVDVWDAAGKKEKGWIRSDLVREIPTIEVRER